jgi:hypothetical protein
MKKVIGLAIAAVLGGCTYYTPPTYSYVPVPCAPGTVTPAAIGTPAASGTITPVPAPADAQPASTAATVAPALPPGTPAAGAGCLAIIPNYTYPAYYSYPAYGPAYYPAYYPGYYAPPVYGSVFVGGHFH